MTSRATIPLLFLLATGLLFAAAVGASREEEAAEEGRRGEHSLRQCQQRCERDRPRYQRAECVQECKQEQQRWEQEQGRGRRGDREQEQKQGRGRRGDREQEQGHGRRGDREREGEEQEESRRPYVFGPRSFRRVVRTDHGLIKALRPFNKESRLLRGIKNYRVAIMEVNPRGFIVPGYADADCVGYIAQGEGVATAIENGQKRSFTVRQGDAVMAPAGSIMHLANTDGRRKLVIAKIVHTVSVPGKFQYFLGESLVSSLSKRVQRAAFKTSEERLEKLFGRQGQKQKKGFIVRASEEQIRELRRDASEGGQGHHWPLPPFGGDSRDTYNLLEQRPTIANRHGRLYEADARSFRPLADHDLRVSFANITAGSMTAPFYNTQSVKIAVVLEGEGEVEIVCPHLSQDSERRRHDEEGQSERGKGRWREEEEDDEQQQRGRGRQSESESESEEEQEQQYEKYETVRARVSRGSAFVVPTGHPVVMISSSRRGGSNLQVVCFEIRAEKNERVWLAGKNNVLAKLDRPAKELAFGAPEREVDEVLRAQQDEGFLAGPEQQQQEEERRGRGEEAVETLLRMATGAL